MHDDDDYKVIPRTAIGSWLKIIKIIEYFSQFNSKPEDQHLLQQLQ